MFGVGYTCVMSRSSDEHEARARALREVEDVADRLREHDRAGEALLSERREAARAARALGVPIRDLQTAMGDLSRSRVNKVLGSAE